MATESILSMGWLRFSRIDKIIGLCCKRTLWKRLYSAKETCNFIDPTNRSHPIRAQAVLLTFGLAVINRIHINWCIYSCWQQSATWSRLLFESMHRSILGVLKNIFINWCTYISWQKSATWSRLLFESMYRSILGVLKNIYINRCIYVDRNVLHGVGFFSNQCTGLF